MTRDPSAVPRLSRRLRFVDRGASELFIAGRRWTTPPNGQSPIPDGYEPEVFGLLDIRIRIFSTVIVDAFWP